MSQYFNKKNLVFSVIVALLFLSGLGVARSSHAAESGLLERFESELKLLSDELHGDKSVKRKISTLSANPNRASLFHDLNYERIEIFNEKYKVACSSYLGQKGSESLEAFCADKTVGNTGFAQAMASCMILPSMYSKAMAIPMHRLVTCSVEECKKGADACGAALVSKADREKIVSSRRHALASSGIGAESEKADAEATDVNTAK